MELTSEQLHTLRHMLGINDPSVRDPVPYRNCYAADPGNPEMIELERIGAVRFYCRRYELDFYVCTDAGISAAIASHKSIRDSKKRRVYSRFLDCRECCPDLTFRQFLTDAQFAQTRRDA